MLQTIKQGRRKERNESEETVEIRESWMRRINALPSLPMLAGTLAGSIGTVNEHKHPPQTDTKKLSHTTYTTCRSGSALIFVHPIPGSGSIILGQCGANQCRTSAVRIHNTASGETLQNYLWGTRNRVWRLSYRPAGLQRLRNRFQVSLKV